MSVFGCSQFLHTSSAGGKGRAVVSNLGAWYSLIQRV